MIFQISIKLYFLHFYIIVIRNNKTYILKTNNLQSIVSSNSKLNVDLRMEKCVLVLYSIEKYNSGYIKKRKKFVKPISERLKVIYMI